ncbi:MAG: RNase adapter RapZ [Oscillospiraceae bacterium]
MNLLVVTGLSGAGKSLAMNALEDIGFFCIDNIPASLLPKLMEFAQQSESALQKLAVVLDIRGGRSAKDITDALSPLNSMNVVYKVLFLDCSNEALERRYTETRRRHPISIQDGVNLTEAIIKEKNILQPLYENADYKIDTSLFTAALLKDKIVSLFAEKSVDSMRINIMSFGFKYGQPKEADMLLDVRCMPNPFYIENLKHLTGLDKQVSDYVFSNDEAIELLKHIEGLLQFSLPLYIKEGKSQFTIAIGCTGGKHRSIAYVEKLAAFCKTLGYEPLVEHRDIDRFY